ncbi:TetR/AcrR family transcriptional regulator [Thermodesulfobacteriota bacterium]
MNKKKQIIQNIAELFYEKGYEKTTIRDISRSSNISKPGLYYHFENKQEMLFAIIDDFMTTVLTNLKENIGLIKSPQEKLLFIIQSHIRFFVKYPAQTKVVIYEVHSLEGDYVVRFKKKQVEYIKIIKNILKEIIKDTDTKIDIHVSTFCLIGMLNWIVQWYKPEGKVSPESLAREIWVLLLSGLSGDPSLLSRNIEE